LDEPEFDSDSEVEEDEPTSGSACNAQFNLIALPRERVTQNQIDQMMEIHTLFQNKAAVHPE
jgi:hypothetical protein